MQSLLKFCFISSFQVSVFDSVVQGGDSVWEGLRVYSGKIFKLEEHLDRLVLLFKSRLAISLPLTFKRSSAADLLRLRTNPIPGKKETM